MAQSTLVSLTVDYQGSTFLGGVTRGFDINNFASPLQRTAAGTIVRYVEAGSYSIKQNEPSAIINYTVQEALAAIALVTEGAVVLTVEKRGVTDTVNETFLTPESMLFDVNKIAGQLTPTGSGTGFYYREAGSANPIYYKVSESVSAIIAAVPVGPVGQLTGTLTAPFIPYATGASTLADGPLSVRNDGGTINVMLARSTSFRSDIAGEAQIGFDADGLGINAYTDGGAGLESIFAFRPEHIRLTNTLGTGAVLMDATQTEIKHSLLTLMNSPSVQLIDTASLDCDTPGGTVGLFNVNPSAINFGASGANISVAATMSMLGARLQLAAATVAIPSLNIPAGVAPAAPANGDIWFDGADVKIRVAGVTRTFTIV